MRSRQTVLYLFGGAAVGLTLLFVPVLAEVEQPKAPAQSEAQESGDPTKLKPVEIRTIWDTLATLAHPADDELKGGDVKIRYPNGLDLYMSLRQGELAQELGIRAWTVDFVGGPFRCWLEIARDGQKSKRWQPEQEGIDFICKVKSGRLLCWFLPVASEMSPSERSRRITKLLKESNQFGGPIPQVFSLQVIGGPNISRMLAGNPQMPELWSTWNDVSIREVSRAKPGKISGEVTLLEVEAVEKGQAKGAQPRKLKLSLKAKPSEEK
jgi:hypothetical protein